VSGANLIPTPHTNALSHRWRTGLDPDQAEAIDLICAPLSKEPAGTQADMVLVMAMLVVVGPVAGEIVAIVVVATEEGNEGEQAVSSLLYLYILLSKSLSHTLKKT